MVYESDYHEQDEQLGLTEKDKQDLEKSGLKMFEKIVNDYPNELPDIVVLPDTAARPLAYIADEVFGKIAKERGVKKPTMVFFWVHFPYDRTFIHQMIHKNADLMDFDRYRNELDMSEFQPETIARFEQVRSLNSERAKQITDAIKRRTGDPDHALSVMAIDDQIGYTAATARELSVAFGNTVPTYGFISMFDDSHYQEHGIPVKTGMVTERETFNFRKDKDAIGFYKDDFYIKDLYPMYKYDDDNDEERRMIKMMYLRNEMREVGKKIAEQIDSHSIWSEEDFVELRESRNFADEDLCEIETLAKLPKVIALNHHNYFSLNSERLVGVLDKDIENLAERIMKEADQDVKVRLVQEKTYLQALRRLSDKYDWTALWNINVVLERRKVKQKKVSN